MDNWVAFSAARMLSPRGRCATFSADADGYARGEGCGAVVLSSTSEKVAGSCWANVLGTAVNQDGRSATLTAPNGPSQERVVKTAQRRAGVCVDVIGYIEAHGTGTALGDPQEVNALSNVFASTDRLSSFAPVVLGSIKTNIGHLEGAAGMAGLVKAVACVQHRSVTTNLLHGTKLNGYLKPSLQATPILVPTSEEAEIRFASAAAGIS